MMGGAPIQSVRRGGFTLIEVVSTIAVLSALATVASGILFTATGGYLQASTTAQLHSERSIALDRAVRELRNIELDGEADGIAPDIDSVTADSIAWSDDCSLALSGRDLMLGIDGGGPAVLLSDVSAFIVQTYDEDNSALAATLSGGQCDDIRRVSIVLTVRRYGVSATLRSRVVLRSTMQGSGTGA